MDTNSFAAIVKAILELGDFLCYVFLAYAGFVWMTGDKTKAIERAIGVASGYLIIRKAEIIRDFLKALVTLPVIMRFIEQLIDRM